MVAVAERFAAIVGAGPQALSWAAGAATTVMVFFLLRLFCCLCVDRHAANRRGYYSCDFTQRVIWLSSFGRAMGISLMKVNDNVNENYYYDGRYNRRNVEGKASDMPVAAGRRLN
ncbi:hypothetical protein LNP05_07565 [Klebsiella pneumoniae subsp. pneumoniae]|nr:hypothetical protein [Klebsiella pneumoniae subsp. pneumoniae]